MQASGGSSGGGVINSLSPAVNYSNWNNYWVARNTLRYNSGITVMGVTNHFLFGFILLMYDFNSYMYIYRKKYRTYKVSYGMKIQYILSILK